MSDIAYGALLERELDRMGVIVAIDASDHNIHTDEAGWEHRRAWVTVARKNHGLSAGKIETAYRSGTGITNDPSVADVFSALLSDADLGSQEFAEFASELGYDEDSRKAYAIWEECRDVFDRFATMFTEAELETLSELAREL